MLNSFKWSCKIGSTHLYSAMVMIENQDGKCPYLDICPHLLRSFVSFYCSSLELPECVLSDHRNLKSHTVRIILRWDLIWTISVERIVHTKNQFYFVNAKQPAICVYKCWLLKHFVNMDLWRWVKRQNSKRDVKGESREKTIGRKCIALALSIICIKIHMMFIQT